MPNPIRRMVLGATVAICTLTALGPALADDRLNIVATTGMIADALRQTGGERVTVSALMGPGVDPHGYRQTRSDIAAMTRADAIFRHGLYLEAQLEDLFLTLARQKPVIALAEALPPESLLAHDEYADQFDPHVWMDPRLWSQVVIAAQDALITLDPEGEATFRANTERYLAEIAELAGFADRTLASVPEAARVLVTAHDAFNYFGRAYGYEVMGIQGISTESEAGLKQIEDLVNLLVARRIGAIFVESSVPDRNVKALIEGAAAKGHPVVIGGELFSDAMGRSGTYEGSYIGMIDHNVTIITRALGGTAPERGMQDALGL